MSDDTVTGKSTDEPDFAGSLWARCNAWKQRCDELHDAQPKWRPIAEAEEFLKGQEEQRIIVVDKGRVEFGRFGRPGDKGNLATGGLTVFQPLPEPPEPAPEAESPLPGLAAEVDDAGHYFEPETESPETPCARPVEP